MRFGLFGGVARGPGQVGDEESYEAFADYVVAAEALGFESAFLVEHHFTGNGQLSASLTLLAFLARATSTIRLGTAVTVMPWHNPLLLAEQAALVDVLSGGRLEFGVGRGYRPNEFHGFCVDPTEAQARFEEGVEVVLRSWNSRDKRFSHEGRFWRFKDVVAEPMCVQQPHPPIWVAAGSEASVRAAASKRQNLLLDQFGDAELTKQRVGWYRDQLAQEGLPWSAGTVAVTRGLLLTKDNDPVVREAEIDRRLDLIASVQTSAQIPGAPASAAPEKSFVDDSRAATESAAILGPPEECIARLKALEAAGVDWVLLNDAWGGIERLRHFAQEVMPAFEAPAPRRRQAAVAS